MATQDVGTLIDMGFPKDKAVRALEITGNQGVEPAMEWLLAHGDESFPVPSSEATTETTQPSVADTAPVGDISEHSVEPSKSDESSGSSETAKSLKCNECGKLFATQLEIEYHAAKSGHSNFSESTEEKKPLTEEEKREQLRKLEEKMKQKRLEREEKEKKEALERERLRIRSGKEMNAARKKLEEDDMKKLIEQRKREKLEEKMARQRVKDQIEQDKIARRTKFGMGPAPEAAATSPTASPVPTPVLQVQPPAQKDYTQTKLQIRLTNGQALTQTFGAKEQLAAVRLYVELNRTDGAAPFSLMTNFPKKIFSDDDYNKSLEALGLAPSAVVIVSRVQQ